MRMGAVQGQGYGRGESTMDSPEASPDQARADTGRLSSASPTSRIISWIIRAPELAPALPSWAEADTWG